MLIKVHGTYPSDIAISCNMRYVLNLTDASAFALYRDWFNTDRVAYHRGGGENSNNSAAEYAEHLYDFTNSFLNKGYKIISETLSSGNVTAIYKSDDYWYLISFDTEKFCKQWIENHPKYDAPYEYSDYSR